jgi:hypothetical protein
MVGDAHIIALIIKVEEKEKENFNIVTNMNYSVALFSSWSGP